MQVNVAGEEGKARHRARGAGRLHRALPGAGGRPDDDAALRRATPRTTARHFARLAELAAEHGLARLSMGTTQDYEVAVQEGATIVRIGAALYE